MLLPEIPHKFHIALFDCDPSHTVVRTRAFASSSKIIALSAILYSWEPDAAFLAAKTAIAASNAPYKV